MPTPSIPDTQFGFFDLIPSSGNLNAKIESHPNFESIAVYSGYAHTPTVALSISALSADDKAAWHFYFDKNIKPGTYLIGDAAIIRIVYMQAGLPYDLEPAPVIGKIVIEAFDLTEGLFKANFDFSLWNRHEPFRPVINTNGTIDVWDIPAYP